MLPPKNQPSSNGKEQKAERFMRLPSIQDLNDVDIVIAGVPFDGGTPPDYIGSSEGPKAMRVRSARIQPFHPTHGFSPFENARVADIDDCNIYPTDQARSLESIESFFRPLADRGLRVVTLGGDHLVTLPILRALAADRAVGLVHFDAHNDTADTSSDGQRFSSATPFRRAVEEKLVDPHRVVQIGIRGPTRTYDKERWARDQGMRVITMDEFHNLGVDEVIRETRRVVDGGPVYVTFDIDGIDPAFAPGTGTPAIGGLTTYESLRVIRSLCGLDVIGGDVTEMSPRHDINDATALVGATLAYEMLCLASAASSSESQGKA